MSPVLDQDNRVARSGQFALGCDRDQSAEVARTLRSGQIVAGEQLESDEVTHTFWATISDGVMGTSANCPPDARADPRVSKGVSVSEIDRQSGFPTRPLTRMVGPTGTGTTRPNVSWCMGPNVDASATLRPRHAHPRRRRGAPEADQPTPALVTGGRINGVRSPKLDGFQVALGGTHDGGQGPPPPRRRDHASAPGPRPCSSPLLGDGPTSLAAGGTRPRVLAPGSLRSDAQSPPTPTTASNERPAGRYAVPRRRSHTATTAP